MIEPAEINLWGRKTALEVDSNAGGLENTNASLTGAAQSERPESWGSHARYRTYRRGLVHVRKT